MAYVGDEEAKHLVGVTWNSAESDFNYASQVPEVIQSMTYCLITVHISHPPIHVLLGRCSVVLAIIYM